MRSPEQAQNQSPVRARVTWSAATARPAVNDKTYVGGSVVVATTATTRRVDYLTDRLTRRSGRVADTVVQVPVP